MLIIREIKAAWRWVFNIKDEVKQDIEVNPKDKFIDIFNDDKVNVISVKNGYVYYRFVGSVKASKLTVDMFLDHYRKIS